MLLFPKSRKSCDEAAKKCMAESESAVLLPGPNCVTEAKLTLVLVVEAARPFSDFLQFLRLGCSSAPALSVPECVR
jgi:hypothetical protein